MIVVACIISDCKQISDVVLADIAFIQQILCHTVHFIVDERAGYQPAVLVVLFCFKSILERDGAPFGQECIACDGVKRIPLHLLDAEVG